MKEKKPNILHFTELDSTNNYISAHKDELNDGDICIADFQTAGKGQRGNGWESEEGKNLTFSILLKPQKISSTRQFIISQAVTLGIVSYLAERGIEAKIKWPNDIYVSDLKICGILIENSVMAAILSCSVVGIGININQKKFISNAPNPVSLAMLNGREYELKEELSLLISHIMKEYRHINSTTEERFLQHLYRKDEWHSYIDKASNKEFIGKIIGTDPTARLMVALQDGSIQHFAFKEIGYILEA